MFGIGTKTMALILGLMIVTGAGGGLLLASKNYGETPEVRPQEESNGDTPVALPAASVTSSTSPPSSVSPTPSLTTPQSPAPTAPRNTSAPLPAPVLAPVSASTLPPAPSSSPPASPSALMRALHGLWKAEKKVFVNNATGQVIREEGMGRSLFYSSFDGEKRCENVELVEGAPRCSGGYTPYTIDAKGAIWEGSDRTFEIFKDGVLKASYGAGTPTSEVHVYVKVSSQPVSEVEY